MRRLTDEEQDAYLALYADDPETKDYKDAAEFLNLTNRQVKATMVRRRRNGEIDSYIKRPYTKKKLILSLTIIIE